MQKIKGKLVHGVKFVKSPSVVFLQVASATAFCRVLHFSFRWFHGTRRPPVSSCRYRIVYFSSRSSNTPFMKQVIKHNIYKALSCTAQCKKNNNNNNNLLKHREACLQEPGIQTTTEPWFVLRNLPCSSSWFRGWSSIALQILPDLETSPVMLYLITELNTELAIRCCVLQFSQASCQHCVLKIRFNIHEPITRVLCVM